METDAAMEERTRRFGFWLTAAAALGFGAAVAAPSPVYPLYAAEWGLAPVVLTVMFAIYVAGMLAVLLTAGSLSDFLGRRAVAVPATALSLLGLLLLATADGPGTVIVARVVQGVAMALVVGALGASLLDLAPPLNPRLAATLNGAIWPLGLATGALLGSVLVEFAPHPTRLVFWVLSAVTLVLGIALCFLPDRSARRPGALASLTPTISLPPQVRGIFLAVLGCLLAAWALGGLYLGMGASVVRQLFHVQAALAGGLAIASVTGIGAIVGILTQRLDALRVMIWGSIALVVGPLLTVVAVAADASWLFFVSSIVGGLGFGAGFQGGLRLIVAEVPPAERAGVLSGIYLVCYVAFSLPAVIAGLLTPSLGLEEVVIGYAVFVGALSASALLIQLLRRSAREIELAADEDEQATGAAARTSPPATR